MPFNAGQPDDVVLDLLAAKEAIQRGWIKGHFLVNDGYCALGALGGEHEHGVPAIKADAVAYLYRALPSRYRWNPFYKRWAVLSSHENKIAAYNDAPWRVKREVLTLYDRAIELARRP